MSISPNVNRNSKQETLGIDSDCENKIERNKKLEIKRSKYVNKEQLWTMEWHGLCLILLEVCYGATLSCLFFYRCRKRRQRLRSLYVFFLVKLWHTVAEPKIIESSYCTPLLLPPESSLSPPFINGCKHIKSTPSYLLLSMILSLPSLKSIVVINVRNKLNKKLSYCWETVRRDSMPRIAEMDVEITT